MLVKQKVNATMIKVAKEEMGFALNENSEFSDTEQEGQDLKALEELERWLRMTCRELIAPNELGVSMYSDMGKGVIIKVKDQGYTGIFWVNVM